MLDGQQRRIDEQVATNVFVAEEAGKSDVSMANIEAAPSTEHTDFVDSVRIPQIVGRRNDLNYNDEDMPKAGCDGGIDIHIFDGTVKVSVNTDIHNLGKMFCAERDADKGNPLYEFLYQTDISKALENLDDEEFENYQKADKATAENSTGELL